MAVLKSLLLNSKDGEWGKGEHLPDSTRMSVIRGTDFEATRIGMLAGIPSRFIPNRIAERKKLRVSDIILETAGGSKDKPTGRTLLVTAPMLAKAPYPVTCASFARFLRVDPQKAFPPYVFWLLQHLYKNGVLFKYHTQHTGVARFQYTTFSENEELELPPLPTQRRIASILSAYDDLIENNTRRIAVLEEMARRIYEEWFVQFRFPGHENAVSPGELPEGWRRGPISDLYAGLYDGPHATPKPSTEGPIFLGIGNLTESGHLDLSAVRHIAEEEFSKWTKRVTPQPGDIVFTYEATLNRYAIIPRGFHGCLGRRLALIRVDPRRSSSLFLYCSFFSSDWRTIIAQNTLSGATVDRIPLSKLPRFPVNIPPQEIISRFDAMVRPMFDLMHALSQKNANLRAQRDLLLPKLISGEIDVSTLPLPGAEDEAA